MQSRGGVPVTGSRFEEHRFGFVVMKLDAEGETCVLTVDKPGFGTRKFRYNSIEEVIAGHATHRGRATFDEVSKSFAEALQFAGKAMRQFRDPEATR